MSSNNNSNGNPLKVVDFKNPNTEQVIADLYEAATTQGFLFIDGHDFSNEEVSNLLKLAQQYFELPLETKMANVIDDTNKGYSDLRGEKLDLSVGEEDIGDPKEAFNFGDITFSDGKPHQDLPQLFQGSQNAQTIQTTNKKLYQLVLLVLEKLSIALKIDENEGGKHWFADRYRADEPNGSALRFLKYPPQGSCDPNELVRAGAHTDYGAVTLLFQFKGQEGLEVYSTAKREWQRVPYIDSIHEGSAAPIIVNFGDQLSYWTAGTLKSTVHRVKFPESSIKENRTRYSIVFFSHPEHSTLLEPIPSEVIKKVKGRGANNENGEVLTARQHLDKKLLATYFRLKK